MQISSKSRFLIFNSKNCLRNCIYTRRLVTIFNKKIRFKDRKSLDTFNLKENVDIVEIIVSTFIKIIENKKNQIIAI